jgi:hypothetical protein
MVIPPGAFGTAITTGFDACPLKTLQAPALQDFARTNNEAPTGAEVFHVYCVPGAATTPTGCAVVLSGIVACDP